VEDDGTVIISHHEAAGAEAAKLRVEALTEEIKIGKVYTGRVTSVKEFGAFIEILPGRDGLCHISELDDKYVDRVEEVCKVGDLVQVKVIAIDDQDRVKLSRKALLREQAGKSGMEPASVERSSRKESSEGRDSRSDRRDRSDRGDGDRRDRGGNGERRERSRRDDRRES
jgi:polyribonucleotide nucleotidyltransferase